MSSTTNAPHHEPRRPVDGRTMFIAALAVAVAAIAAGAARALGLLIAFITNLAFYGTVSTEESSPAGNQLGLLVVLVPAVGGLIVGLMARFGSKAIRGHGIPEAMEQILLRDSRIPARMTLLKPLSAAIAIGTGGPFGSEGPIIATGGALGSLVGQIVRVTANERKTLLAAGAAAGMAATFGTPVSAVLLAIELLLFEYRAASVIPVALATAVATSIRVATVGAAPVFPVSELAAPTGEALVVYIVMGGFLGLASVAVTRIVYAVEDLFEKTPMHWTWWPALGGLAVGLIGFFAPRTLGVGYANIRETLNGDLAGTTLLVLCVAKLASWAISLGSGTSGGTLAPLLTIGGAVGGLSTLLACRWLPGHGIDMRVGALVGMAAMFAGASRALLASVLFAFECTQQSMGLLPLLGGCTAAYLVSSLLMKNSIMTEKLARRGVRVSSEYQADFLEGLSVRDHATREVVAVTATVTIADARRFLEEDVRAGKHQAFPVMRGSDVIGFVTRREVFAAAVDAEKSVETLVRRAAIVIAEHSSLRDAADVMASQQVGRVAVVAEPGSLRLVGIVTRSDLLRAHEPRLVARDRRVRLRGGFGLGRQPTT